MALSTLYSQLSTISEDFSIRFLLILSAATQPHKEKDSEVLRLRNQIATDMIRKDDVDRLIEEAVTRATSALKADYEEHMKAMAAEYEAKIATLL